MSIFRESFLLEATNKNPGFNFYNSNLEIDDKDNLLMDKKIISIINKIYKEKINDVYEYLLDKAHNVDDSYTIFDVKKGMYPNLVQLEKSYNDKINVLIYFAINEYIFGDHFFYFDFSIKNYKVEDDYVDYNFEG